MILNVRNAVTKVGTICLFTLLCLALPVIVNAQPDTSSADSAKTERASLDDQFRAQKGSGTEGDLWQRLEYKWVTLSIFRKIITLGSSVILCVTLMVIFWAVYPFTVAPIEFLLNSFMALLFGRLVAALFGGAIGFALPFVILIWSGGNPNMKSKTAVGVQQVLEEERSSGPLHDDNRVSVPNVDPDTREGNEGRAVTARSDNKPSEEPTSQHMTGADKAIDSKNLVPLKLAELQGSLAMVNSKIEFERKRWLDANATINALTNNKTTPVVRNSPEHVKMYESQVVMKQVEAGAPALKAEKSRLEAMIKSLQQSASTMAP